MDRPYIICHMTASIDGKVTGEFLSAPGCEAAVETYYEINRRLKCGGFICGRITMEESFTGGWYPDLSNYKSVDHGPFPTNFWLDEECMTGFYAIAFDPKGKLGWKSRFIEDSDPGYDRAQIIEVLTEQVDKRYLAYLEEMEIPYLIAGKDEIDVALALRILHDHIGTECLLLEGGSVVNGYFQRAGAVDELSLVVAPVIGGKEDKPLFTDAVMEGYRLTECTSYDSGVVWMRYRRQV